jgi:outer membrane protein assembly factor BamA
MKPPHHRNTFFLVWCLLCFFSWFQSAAQNNIKFQLISSDKSSVAKNINYKSSYASVAAIEEQLHNIVISLQNQGYLLASVDSSRQDSLHYTAFLSIGDKYNWTSLRPAKGSEEVLAETGYRERFYTRVVFYPKELARLVNKTIAWCENNGYPFASVKLDSTKIEGDGISALFRVTKNKFVKIDSILIEGNAQISKTFIKRYLQVKEGSAYNEGSLKNINNRIRQLPFVKEVKSQLVRITDKSTKLYLFLDKKNASQFDGIIGLLPDAAGKTVFTGDVRIKLQNNVFKAGELIDLNWRRLQTQTQDLKTRIVYPYLFNTPVGTDYTLKIYRRDTTFVDIQNNIGLQYIFSGLNNIKVFYKQRNTNLLSTSGLETVSTLPDYADISTSSYGLGLTLEKLDYRFNPRKGIAFNATGSVGSRHVRKNGKLNSAIYNNINLSSTQYQTEADIAAYIPLFKKSTIKLGGQFATVYGEQIFKNELFRIGGLKTLRGVNEESIFASTYGISTIEYRYLFEQNSAIYLFADAAWYENNSINTYITDMPYGVGAGISFETKAGIFSLNYALGKQFSNPLDIRSGKIHFGIVNSF